MSDLPGAGQKPRLHHRRPPAHKSVSLRHSPPAAAQKSTRYPHQPTSQGSPVGPASDKANPPSSVSPKITNKQSTGESSDAGKWFENTNNAVQGNTSFVDNDPPFFLRNSSSSATPPDGQDPRLMAPHRQSTAMPYRPGGLTQLHTEGSSTEDFRSVIDDLTVANKRLKQKLKKYEKMYDAHLQDEKLFEVRFHGLADHKKKELEETLCKFAADLGDSSTNDRSQVSYAPILAQGLTASSHTSRNAESGYVSMSASGQNSTSAPSAQEDKDRRVSKSTFNRQQQNVHSYLHDIPAGLLPKHSAPMTEKSKKKLVVRRLEQIFAGKRSAPGAHPQPMQQEEVAQSAAMADRRAKEASGEQAHSEGMREARIMSGRTEDEDITEHAPPEGFRRLRNVLRASDLDAGGSGSPDQRPTRPLDLDPYRAQVPAENMEYIRHLGFTPPDMISGDAPQDGHGWLYLNLLINMAQLHTINVTSDFVKIAVSEFSSKLELSHDGRKIRWKGGYDVTRNSSDTSSDHLGSASPYEGQASGKSPRKRIKTGTSGSSESFIDPERKARKIARALREKEKDKFTYTPLFFHKEDSEDDEDYYNLDMGSSSNSLMQAQPRGDSSGFGSSAMRSSSSRRKREDGPIIFYNKAKFCTDLSGDRRGASVANPSSYKSITNQPVGADAIPLNTLQRSSGIAEPRGPLDASSMEIDSRDGGRTSSSEEEFGFSPEALRRDSGDASPETMEFEVSGLGGVQPDDNFSIRVQRRQVQNDNFDAQAARRRSILYPPKILKALKEQPSEHEEASSPSSQPAIAEQIVSATRKNLPSSALPPASFLPFDSASSSDTDSDLESDVSSNPSTTSSSDRGPTTALQLLNVSPTHAPNSILNSDHSEEVESNSDDASVDLLATARALDPITIRASEREYDAAFADRLAEEIPAGSSAATAGGGSGFNSPISVGMAADEGASATKSASVTGRSEPTSASKKNLKRTRTNDSFTTGLQPGKNQKLD